MSEGDRPPSRWSTSMSITTKSTSGTNRTAPPLVAVRRKLCRPSINNQKTLAQRMAKSKHDMEELFKLYYANDLKFDTFHRQIVTGTRIPTARTSPITLPDCHLPNNSPVNGFHSKHCVSKEQWSISDMDEIDIQPPPPPTNDEVQIPKRTVQIRIDTDANVLPEKISPIPSSVDPVVPVSSSLLLETPPSNHPDELIESSLIKSVPIISDITTENIEHMLPKIMKTSFIRRPFSSKVSFSPTYLPPAPPSSFILANIRKDPAPLSCSSASTLNSLPQQQQSKQPSIVTGAAMTVRQRSANKSQLNKQRTKSSLTTTSMANSQQSTNKNIRPPPVNSPPPPPPPDTSPIVSTQRVVSIPSKCSRYVLVTFPETPVRYSVPTYVERLLLPERFPTLFQNIVHSYNQHIVADSLLRPTSKTAR